MIFRLNTCKKLSEFERYQHDRHIDVSIHKMSLFRHLGKTVAA